MHAGALPQHKEQQKDDDTNPTPDSIPTAALLQVPNALILTPAFDGHTSMAALDKPTNAV
jgi:hypothetical protein